MNRLYLLIFLLLPLITKSQVALPNQYHDADTLIYNGKRIKPGDTLQLGFGSDANKDFVFISFYGGLMTATPAKMPAVYANHQILFDHMIHKGSDYYPVFYLDGKKKNSYRYLVDFGNAVLAKEILIE
jgi:hypothetical protein